MRYFTTGHALRKTENQQFKTFCKNQTQTLETMVINLNSNLIASFGLEEINFILLPLKQVWNPITGIKASSWESRENFIYLQRCNKPTFSMTYTFSMTHTLSMTHTFSTTNTFSGKQYSNLQIQENWISESFLIVELVTSISVYFKKHNVWYNKPW